MAASLFGAIGAGDVRIEVNRTAPLDEVAEVHRDIAASKTVGSVALIT